MRKNVLLGLLVLAMLACGCGSTRISASKFRTSRLVRYPPPPSERTLQAGDRLRIYVHAPTSEVLDRAIDERGYVTLPHINAVHIGGMPTAAAEEAIRQLYVEKDIYKDGSVHVAIVPPVSEFYVRGQVYRPGGFTFTRNVTVLQAVSMAGGPTEFAHKWKRKLIRRQGEIFEIDIKKVRKGEQQDRFIKPGDIVEVPRGLL